MKKTTFLRREKRMKGGWRFPDKSPQGLEGRNMAVKVNKKILLFEDDGLVLLCYYIVHKGW